MPFETPPHDNYPSDPEEPCLLIPPPEHRKGNVLPVVWDPKRSTGGDGDDGHVCSQVKVPKKKRSKTSPLNPKQGTTPWNAHMNSIQSYPRPVSVSPSFRHAPWPTAGQKKWMETDSSLAAHQAMMYYQHPYFFRPPVISSAISVDHEDSSIDSNYFHAADGKSDSKSV